MTEEITTPNLTPELVKGKMLITLSKAEQSIQGLNDAEAQLVYNEDNLETVKKFIDDCKKAEKVVETERVAMKAPYLEAERNVDAGAKLIASGIAEVKLKAHNQYTKLCQEVERKRVAAENEKNRVAAIRKAMDQFKMDYAVRIAGAKTTPELVQLERLINLETANKNRYQEFLPEFVNDCKAIRSLLADQKIKVKELFDLEKQEQEAAETGNDEAVLEIQDKKEALEANIAQTGINLQETAISQATAATPIEPEIVLPEIKGARKYWKWQVANIKETAKKMPTWVSMVVDPTMVEEYLKAKKVEGIEGDEFTFAGIRFYQETKY
jgi:hypothetical protein